MLAGALPLKLAYKNVKTYVTEKTEHSDKTHVLQDLVDPTQYLQDALENGMLSSLPPQKKEQVRKALVVESVARNERTDLKIIVFLEAMMKQHPELSVTSNSSSDGKNPEPGMAELSRTMLDEMAGMALTVADGSGHDKYLPSDDEWDSLESILPVLEIMSHFQVHWQGQEYVSISPLYYQWKTLTAKLKRIAAANGTSHGGVLAQFFVDRLSHREHLILTKSTIIAAFLDPAYKAKLRPQDKELAMKELRRLMLPQEPATKEAKSTAPPVSGIAKLSQKEEALLETVSDDSDDDADARNYKQVTGQKPQGVEQLILSELNRYYWLLYLFCIFV